MFAAWLKGTLEITEIGGGRIGRKTTLLAEELHVDPSYVRRLLRNAVGASPERIWEIGEALRKTGIKWCSGPVALAAAPEYLPHLLGWIGSLFRATKPRPGLGTHLWWELDSPDLSAQVLTVVKFAEDVFNMRGVQYSRAPKSLLIDDATRKVVLRAWKTWTREFSTRGIPDIFRLTIAASVMRPHRRHPTFDPIGDEALRQLEACIRDWLRRGNYMRPAPPLTHVTAMDGTIIPLRPKKKPCS